MDGLCAASPGFPNRQGKKPRGGWRNPAKSKLTDEEVDMFRRLLESGMRQKELAGKFEISKGYASKLANYLVR